MQKLADFFVYVSKIKHSSEFDSFILNCILFKKSKQMKLILENEIIDNQN